MVLTMPSYTSIERRVTMKAFGVDLIVTDPTKGMSGTVPKAYHLVESAPNAFMLQQFSNPTNTQVYDFAIRKSYILLIYLKSKNHNVRLPISCFIQFTFLGSVQLDRCSQIYILINLWLF
ncbi:unnamed protein product [Cuscuta epithymum]|uniref:Uncharacterized protein n=1 Tax=Cuscuta epithymum TaxID=186058 RepID=A0AAV0F5Q2_9ASTE|nr:unnamed protein product [Cuscuta epithymum]